ncbi:MAG: RNA polymerase sigma factor [Gaiellaceae bacterium]
MAELEPIDAELLQKLRRDPQVVGLVYDRYAHRLVSYLQQAGATEEVALDAAQETFARLIVQRRRVRTADDGSLWPWLGVTGRHLLRDWQRRGAVDVRARRRLGIPAADDEASEVVARVEADRLRGRLRLALGRLPEEQRIAVAARVIDELDYSEIAAAAGASEQTVRQRVSRGLRAMQTFLEGGNS